MVGVGVDLDDEPRVRPVEVADPPSDDDVPITIEARTDNGDFILSVANGGVPIPPEARAQLFQPFFRGAVRRSQQGLGLGLFIVNEIAKAHGGTMEVTSSEDRTRFTFTMPRIA